MSTEQQIEQAISEASGTAAWITGSRAVSGGCINQSRVFTLSDGREYFVKTRYQPQPDVFEVEFRSLQLLAGTDTLAVPVPLVYGPDFLVMEAFHAGAAAADWQQQMGRGLAKLHQSTRKAGFGLEFDTYLGTSLQDNTGQASWPDFWREQRLGWQLRTLEQNFAASDPLLKLGYLLMEKLDCLLGPVDEPAVLLHGDLWSGNAAANSSGQPVIYDPACYYGHREAEFGMMRLFGGFDERCEAAYAEIWPFAPDFEERVPVYRLYHEMNHVIMFGAGYYRHCLETLKYLL